MARKNEKAMDFFLVLLVSMILFVVTMTLFNQEFKLEYPQTLIGFGFGMGIALVPISLLIRKYEGKPKETAVREKVDKKADKKAKKEKAKIEFSSKEKEPVNVQVKQAEEIKQVERIEGPLMVKRKREVPPVEKVTDAMDETEVTDETKNDT